MKFAQIKSKEGLHWALLIDNAQDFNLFLKDKAKDLYTAYTEAKESAKKWGYATHVSPIAYCIAMELEKHSDRENVFDDITIYSNVFLKSFIDMFNQYGKILIWQNTEVFNRQKYSGCMSYETFINHPMKLELINIVEKDELIFPKANYNEEDISINTWQDGKHYYAKIGNVDVIVNGEVKWNSYESAMRNAKQFLKELK